MHETSGFVTIAVVAILGAISPGPNIVVVTKKQPNIFQKNRDLYCLWSIFRCFCTYRLLLNQFKFFHSPICIVLQYLYTSL